MRSTCDTRYAPWPVLCVALCFLTASSFMSCERHNERPVLIPDVAAGLTDVLADLVRVQHVRIAEQPDDVSRYLELGMLYDSNSVPRAAAEAYLAAVDCSDRVQATRAAAVPGSGDLAELKARSLYHLGRMQEQMGEVLAAQESFRACVAVAPQVAMAHARLGELQLNSGALAPARASFEASRRAEPAHPAGWEGLARVALAEGDAEAASALLEEYLQTQPDRGYARFLLGTAYRRLGRVADALEQLERGAGASPALPDPWLEETQEHLAGYHGIMGRAVLQGRAGAAQEIVESLRALRAELPDDVAALEKLVAAELQLQQLASAEEALDDFLGRHPEHPRAWYLRALVREAAGDLASASSAVARSLSEAEGWVPSHELAARLAWRSGDLSSAATALEQALHYGGPKLDSLLKLSRARGLSGDRSRALQHAREAVAAFPRSLDACLQLGGLAMGFDRAAAQEAQAAAQALAPEDPRVLQMGAALSASFPPDSEAIGAESEND